MTSDDANVRDEAVNVPDELPVLPLRDVVVYPFIIAPLSVAREISISAVDSALAENRMILLTAQRDKDVEEPAGDDIFRMGTVAVIMRMLKLPDGRIRVLVQGVCRARITEVVSTVPYLQARIERVSEPECADDAIEQEARMRSVKRLLERASSLGKNLPSEVMVIAGNLEEPGRLADLAASNLDLKVEEAQEVLETLEPGARLTRIHDFLKREMDLLSMQREIDSLARDEMDRSQREYYLRHQMKAIMMELGEGNELHEEVEQYREKAKDLKFSDEAEKEFGRQLKKLERMHPDSTEATTVRNYLDWMTDLPWGKCTEDNLDLETAAGILDEDHHGLGEIKQRILEYLSVRKLKNDSKGPILCFVGPPGVGKTSLGRSIARSLGRNFFRLALGGVKDEAEIRGHRRTYVGSMPGRVIQGIHHTGSQNPVFMLDEVDKISSDFRGDPSAALLEVLDPEQNHTFRDHYLGVPYDLSDTLFIATANLLDPIQPAFRDRMEVIRLSGYTEEEKLTISQRHLVPRQIHENGLGEKLIEFSENSLRTMIGEYTREAGLRNLERTIGSVCRKVAHQVAQGRKKKVRVIASSLEAYLGPAIVSREEAMQGDQVGVATGLAWTESGGDVLFIEATIMSGKGNLILTGQLGDVMKESAQAALSYARTHAAEFDIPADYFDGKDIHIHVPQGAIPKDGPSAGITLATAMLSVFTGRPVRSDVAMTGEITLRGNVLPVGGIKEKVLAARRSGIKKIILPKASGKQVDEVPKALRRDIEFVLASQIDDVLAVALTPAGKPSAPARVPAASGREPQPTH
ncbi:MAG: endopeptidase La [Acidobacteriota bacterium]|nr:endopeptidase La [Acidobacteriota bacterium]MDH3783852.1 endopeptidase La [Acidobacteriota bacterium]